MHLRTLVSAAAAASTTLHCFQSSFLPLTDAESQRGRVASSILFSQRLRLLYQDIFITHSKERTRIR